VRLRPNRGFPVDLPDGVNPHEIASRFQSGSPGCLSLSWSFCIRHRARACPRRLVIDICFLALREDENEHENDWLLGALPYQVYSINTNATANAIAAAESTLRLNLLIRLS
jgi:hypothetical protein